MVAAVISILVAVAISVKMKPSMRFASFSFLILILLPFTAYLIAGMKMVLSGMSGAEILSDFFSIAGQCYTEPFRLATPPAEGSRPLNPTFAVTGTLVILGTLISCGQFIQHIMAGSKKT